MRLNRPTRVPVIFIPANTIRVRSLRESKLERKRVCSSGLELLLRQYIEGNVEEGHVVPIMVIIVSSFVSVGVAVGYPDRRVTPERCFDSLRVQRDGCGERDVTRYCVVWFEDMVLRGVEVHVDDRDRC